MRLLKIWNRFWFAPQAPINLSVLRIALVVWALHRFCCGGTPETILSLSQTPSHIYDPLPLFAAMNRVLGIDGIPGNEWIEQLLVALPYLGLLALVGFLTQMTLLLFGLSALYLQGYLYAFGEWHHPPGLALTTLVLLALTPSGRVLSVDQFVRSLWRNPEESSRSSSARWLTRLVQILLALAYLSAACAKLRYGSHWMNGYSLKAHLAAYGTIVQFHSDFMNLMWHDALIVISWISVLFELFFGAMIFIPSLAWLFVPLGLVFHVAIAELMPGANFMSFVALYSVFVSWERAPEFMRDLFGRKRGSSVPG